jgi:hypothetical protein
MPTTGTGSSNGKTKVDVAPYFIGSFGLVHAATAHSGRHIRTLKQDRDDGRHGVRRAFLADALEIFRDQIV